MRKLLISAALATLTIGSLALPAGAGGSVNAGGTVTCSETGTVKFKPALTMAGSGSGAISSKITYTSCTGTGTGGTIASGGGKGAATLATTACLDLQTSPPVTVTTIKWKGSVKVNASTVSNTSSSTDITGTYMVITNSGPVTSGSFNGKTFTETATTTSTVADLIAGCSGKGLKGFTYSSATFSIS